MPLHPTLDGLYDAYGYMCGGIVLTVPMVFLRAIHPHTSAVHLITNPTGAHPIIWRVRFTKHIVESVISWTNSHVNVTNSYLYVEGSLFRHDCISDTYDIQERPTLKQTDNTAGLWWHQKGSVTSTYPPVHLLCFQELHHRYHYYLS